MNARAATPGLFATVLAATTAFWPSPLRKDAAAGLYDAHPNHIWNRVHRHFHVRVTSDGREVGEDELDPLLWPSTAYLLTGSSHERAIKLLDEFLDTRAERLVSDPLKRAVFQHDLWKVFDWLALPVHEHSDARRALASRLAKVMRRVALTRDQIARLPDNYAAAVAGRSFAADYDPQQIGRAFLPSDLFDADGPWVSLSPAGFPFGPIAELHAFHLSESAFSAFLKLPGGRPATLRYLASLWEFPEPYIEELPFPDDRERRATINPALPQLPPGTQVALVRQMLLIDDAGEIVPSNLIESIQLRVFRKPSTSTTRVHAGAGDQDFFEFQLSRRRLFAGESGGLRAVDRDERGFITFSSHGWDPIEMGYAKPTRPVLDGCSACHGTGGSTPLSSVRSAGRLLRPNSFFTRRDPREELHQAAIWKARRYDWGLLQALWHLDAR